MEDGEEVARATPPPVEAVDGTAAGDAFTACLVVSLLENRTREEALRRACIAGALAGVALRCADVAADRRGGGRAPVTHADRHRLRSRPRRRDRDPARARLARGRAARDHDGRRQPDARQDDAERAQGARARRPHRYSRSRPAPTVRSCVSCAPLRTCTARAGSTGLTCRSRRRRPVDGARRRPACRMARARRRARPDRAAHERGASLRAPSRREGAPRADRLDGRRDRGGERHARRRSSTRSSIPRRRPRSSAAGSR